MTNSPVKAAIYLRISLDRNGDGLAVERQRAECLRLVQERGWTVYEEYADESVSAFRKNVKRPAYDRLVADYKAGRFAAIVCYDLDRFTRQPRQLEDWIDAAEETGLVIVTANGEADLSNDNGRMFARIKASVARAEMERKAARQKAKNAQNVALGRPVPGKRRYGFLTGNVKADPVEAPRVTELYARVLAGESVASLAKEWGRQPVRLREILTNPSYAGWVVRKGELFEAADDVDRIVDRETFEKVQVLLSDPSRRTTPGSQVRYLASGIARCGVCGARMVKASVNYLCKGNLSHPTIKASMLDEHLKWEAFSLVASRQHAPSEEVTTLAGNLAELVRQRAAWQEQATWSGADLALIRTRVAALTRDIEKAEDRLAEARTSSVVEDVASALRSELTDQEGAEWWEAKWEELTLESKRQLLAGLDIRVDNGRGLDRVRVTLRSGA